MTAVFKTVREYYSHVKGIVARSGCTDDWNTVRIVPFTGKTGVVRASPLRFRDGAVLRFSEEIILDNSGNVFRPNYSYHYERTGYFFRYDRDPLYKKPVVHEEYHLHVNQKEPRFKTHAASFEEVFDFITAYFYNREPVAD